MRRHLVQYLRRHKQALLESIRQLARAPLATLAVCLIIGITLALPTTLFVFLKNIQGIDETFQNTRQITLYLKKNVNEAQATQLLDSLKKRDDMSQVQAISPDEGLKELAQKQGFTELTHTFSDNPLPWVIVLLPTTYSANAMETLTQNLQQLPEVESLQADTIWAKRLETFIQLAHRTLYALAIFLGIAVLLIINNVIRTATQNNKKEIEVIKLIGGTHRFIRRPFLYTGVIYGFLGVVITWQLVDLFVWVLRSPVTRLTSLYDSSFQLASLSGINILYLLGLGISLGLIGAWMAVTRYLKSI